MKTLPAKQLFLVIISIIISLPFLEELANELLVEMRTRRRLEQDCRTIKGQ